MYESLSEALLSAFSFFFDIVLGFYLMKAASNVCLELMHLNSSLVAVYLVHSGWCIQNSENINKRSQ